MFASQKAHMEFAAKIGEAGAMDGIMQVFDFQTLTSTIWGGETWSDEYKAFMAPFGGMLESPHVFITAEFPSKGVLAEASAQ